MVSSRSPKSKKKAPEEDQRYSAYGTVRATMETALQWARQLEKRTAAGDSIEDIFKKPGKELGKEKRRLDKRKKYLLDKFIFPAMANLTIFTEYTAKSPYLERLFKDELKELFLGVSTKNENKRCIFDRFIVAASRITRTIEKEDGNITNIPAPATDHKLILCDIMQESILYAVLVTGKSRFHYERFLDETLMPDMHRAIAWTRQFAYETYNNLDFDKERRPPQF